MRILFFPRGARSTEQVEAIGVYGSCFNEARL